MKILQVYPYFCPAWSYGGVTRVAYEITRHLVNNGHEVTVYTTDALDNKSRVSINSNPSQCEGAEIYYFRNLSNYLSYKYHIPLPISMPFKIKDDIKKHDIIHLHGYSHILNFLIYIFAKKYHIPYVIQTHGGLGASFQKNNLHRFFSRFFGRRILNGASNVIALTNIEAEQYRRMGVSEDKIEIIPNGIDFSAYDYLPERGEFRRKYSINTDEKIILYLGRIHKIKGIDLLVDAFSDLTKEMNKIRLVIVGPDDGFLSELKRKIENLDISDKVLLTGPLYGEDKFRAYVDTDVYVLPSVYEIFGITVLEAYACSKPIIVSNRCGIADFVDKIGYVINYDRDELRYAMYRVLNEKELGRKFVEKGRNLVKTEFNWDNIVKKIENIYEKYTLKYV